MATVPNYAAKRALLDGAIVADEYPLYSLNMCIPRGVAGDMAWSLYCDERGRCADGRVDHGPVDRVLFLLMLAEYAVHP
jgi:hypothetical protein